MLQKFPIDDDVPPIKKEKKKSDSMKETLVDKTPSLEAANEKKVVAIAEDGNENGQKNNESNEESPNFGLGKSFSCKWTTGAGPRIGCLREYPTELQFQALEQLNLSPRISATITNVPIPSPRPSPKFHLSPKVAHIGLSSPSLQNLCGK